MNIEINIEQFLGIVLLIMAAIVILIPKSLNNMSSLGANTTCYLLVMYILHLLGTLKAELSWEYAMWFVGIGIAWFVMHVAAVKFNRQRSITT